MRPPRAWKENFHIKTKAWLFSVSRVCLSHWVVPFSLLLIISSPSCKDLQGSSRDFLGCYQRPQVVTSFYHSKKDCVPRRIPQSVTEKREEVSFKVKESHEQFDELIIEAADRYEVDPALVKAIIMAESGYNPKAVSSRGAKGLMQLMPRTAKALGVEDCFDPKHNINGGVKYLRKLLDRFDGDVRLSLAAYNAGAANVWRHKGVPPYKATRFYIEKVFKYYMRFKKEIPGDIGRV